MLQKSVEQHLIRVIQIASFPWYPSTSYNWANQKSIQSRQVNIYSFKTALLDLQFKSFQEDQYMQWHFNTDDDPTPGIMITEYRWIKSHTDITGNIKKLLKCRTKTFNVNHAYEYDKISNNQNQYCLIWNFLLILT